MIDFDFFNKLGCLKKKLPMTPLTSLRIKFTIPMFLILLSLPIGLTAQEKASHFIDYYQFPNHLIIKTSDGFLRIRSFSPGTAEFSFAADSNFISPSDAVIAKPADAQVIIRNSPDKMDVRMGDTYFSVNKAEFEIRISTGASMQEEVVIGGPFAIGGSYGVNFRLDTRDKVIGGGARAIDMNRRGKRLLLSNEANWGYEWGAERLNYSLPVFYVSKMYMVFFDSPQKAIADIGQSVKNRFRIESPKSSFTMYVITGGSCSALLSEYTRITGTQPLPPLWALGYLNGSELYSTQADVTAAADSIQKAKFPLDAVLLDHSWYGKGTEDLHMGRLAWDEEKWPRHSLMISNFKQKNINTILMTQPYFLTSEANYAEAAGQGYFATDSTGSPYVISDFWFGKASILDVFNKDATNWYMLKIKPWADEGIAGWWSDLGEPEAHPGDMFYKTGDSRSLHNLYGHTWAKVLSEYYAKNYPKIRLFNLTRSGYAGSQRYSVFPRTGEVKSSWSGLRAQLPIMLTLSISGIPYVHSDIGGFAESSKDEELLVRWAQMGIFSPIFRTYGDNKSLELYKYSPETQKIMRDLINLRYSLMPYIYTMAYQQTVSGKPLVRPLMYVQDDPYLMDIYDMYYFGDNMLVAPVLDQGATSRRVELPVGQWVNLFTGEAYIGGRSIEMPAPLSTLPVFVKAGSFIPMVKPQTSLSMINSEYLTIAYYHHDDVSSAEGELYLDDGYNPRALRDKNYQLFTFKAQNKEKELSIDISHNNGVYLYRPGRREIELQVKNLSERPATIKVDGKNVEFKYTAKTREANIKFTMGAEPVSIKIK